MVCTRVVLICTSFRGVLSTVVVIVGSVEDDALGVGSNATFARAPPLL